MLQGDVARGTRGLLRRRRPRRFPQRGGPTRPRSGGPSGEPGGVECVRPRGEEEGGVIREEVGFVGRVFLVVESGTEPRNPVGTC